MYQLSSGGLAYWTPLDNKPSFTNGWSHWAFTDAGVVQWSGLDSLAPLASVAVAPGLDWAPAMDLRGLRYTYGGRGGRSSFSPNMPSTDCSGFASWAETIIAGRSAGSVYAQTMAMYAQTYAVAPADALPLNLVFYNTQISRNPMVQHMNVYMGDGLVVQEGGVRNFLNIVPNTQLAHWEFRRLY